MVKVKLRIIDRKTLCKNISAKCNYVDPETVNLVYTGLIKTIMDDLRVYGNSYLPNWGLFTLKEMKAHRIGVLREGGSTIISPTRKVKFRPCNQLDYYVKNKL